MSDFYKTEDDQLRYVSGDYAWFGPGGGFVFGPDSADGSYETYTRGVNTIEEVIGILKKKGHTLVEDPTKEALAKAVELGAEVLPMSDPTDADFGPTLQHFTTTYAINIHLKGDRPLLPLVLEAKRRLQALGVDLGVRGEWRFFAHPSRVADFVEEHADGMEFLHQRCVVGTRLTLHNIHVGTAPGGTMAPLCEGHLTFTPYPETRALP
jgi:hypothetical protein